MPGGLPLTEAAMAEYRATARRRDQARRAARAARRTRALELAQAAAALLREQFGATRVVLFGSATREDAFWERSDIDLAAWGIPREDYFTAVARLQELSGEFSVDLVEGDHCRPAIAEAIAAEGRAL